MVDVIAALGIDNKTAEGRLQIGVVRAIAEVEHQQRRARIVAGLARAREQGRRIGRPPHTITEADLARTAHLSQHQAAKALAVPRSVLQRARALQGVPR